MTNTSSLRRLTVASVIALSALALPACGSSTPSGPFPYCYGPETPDDLEDLLDRDTVRVDDSVCASGAYPAGHGIAYAPTWDALPDVGEELDSDSEWGYHRSHRRAKSPTVVYVAKPAAPTRSVLVVREASVGSSQVRRDVSTRANTARKDASVAKEAQAEVQKSTIKRGGLGVGSGSAKVEDAKAARTTSTRKKGS